MKRILFFAYDGTGMGHLMRLLKVASGLSERCLCLMATGHPIVGNVAPVGVEFLHVPNFKNYSSPHPGVKYRAAMMEKLVRMYKPDAIVTDYLPLGKREELINIVEGYNCFKYLILREKIGGKNMIDKCVFTRENLQVIEQYYNRVFVAGNSNMTDFDPNGPKLKNIKEKLHFTGYITYHVDIDVVKDIRQSRLPSLDSKWIVCSAGSGRVGEQLIQACVGLTKDERFKDFYFDIIIGPYSAIKWEHHPYYHYDDGHIRVIRQISQLHLLHASADVVICSGAYNSLLEAMQGTPKHILSYSVQTTESEQYDNIHDFSMFYPIQMIDNLSNLPNLLDEICKKPSPKETDIVQLDTQGIKNISDIILNDLGYDDL